jgi:serine/threonine protein kinase
MAWDTVTGNPGNLPETTPDGDITYHTDTKDQKPLQVLGLEKLGSGICGVVYDSVCISDNDSEETHAVKFVEHDFPSFWRELVIYEKLEGQPFIPAFYGGFAGHWVTGPLGIIIMEMLERSFKSADEMSMDEKCLGPFLPSSSSEHELIVASSTGRHQALSCLEQLHAAGFQQGDIRPNNFGVRNDGKVVMLDFSHAEPCDSSFSMSAEVKLLRQYIFGEVNEEQG